MLCCWSKAASGAGADPGAQEWVPEGAHHRGHDSESLTPNGGHRHYARESKLVRLTFGGALEYALPDVGNYPNTEVAGESYREQEITRALGRSPGVDEEIEATFTAHLVPEPDNPHDKNAISVRVNGHVVGYIERDQTAPYLNAIHRIAASGHTATTLARIWAVRRDSWDGSGISFNSRITVALPWEGLSLPSNNSPAEQYSVLPWGSALQLTGEEEHFDHLKGYVPADGKGLLLLTLHRLERSLKNGSTRECIEARVDGTKIGELSVASSKHFLPVVDHLAKQRMTVAAWGRIKGSALTAEVTVQATKASELPAEWLSGEPTTVPSLVPAAESYSVPPAYIPQPARRTSTQKTSAGGSMVSRVTAQPQKAGCAGVILAFAAIGVAISGATNYLM